MKLWNVELLELHKKFDHHYTLLGNDLSLLFQLVLADTCFHFLNYILLTLELLFILLSPTWLLLLRTSFSMLEILLGNFSSLYLRWQPDIILISFSLRVISVVILWKSFGVDIKGCLCQISKIIELMSLIGFS